MVQPPLYKIKRGLRHVYFNTKYSIYSYISNIISKNLYIYKNIRFSNNCFNIIFKFYKIIKNINANFPQYIIENLLLNNFFFFQLFDF